MIDQIYQMGREKLLKRFWVFSDLQQVLPDMAEECLRIALDDMGEFAPDLSQIWYLGDAMEGKDIDRVSKMTQMQVEALTDFGLPVRYIMGNHDLDCTNPLPANTPPVLPVYEAFKAVPGWRTTKTFTDFYFTESHGDTLVVFLSDHVDPQNRWQATQQGVRGEDPAAYVHTFDDYQKLRNEIADWPGPVIFAGHYAFPGGARGAPPEGLLNQFLPLPDNVKLILHGHAHTGDWPYGREKTFQRIGWVDWHNVPQANISSLDRTRGSQTRSAVLDLYENGTLGLFFRDHEDKIWSDAFLVDAKAPRTASSANLRHHQRRTNLADTALGRWKSQHASD